MVDDATRGWACPWKNDIFDPVGPWRRPTVKEDRRMHHPKTILPSGYTATEGIPEAAKVIFGGGRRMRHPFLAPIVYPELPHRTTGFGYDRLRRSKAVVIKTLDSSAVAHYLDKGEDVIIKEVWQSPHIDFFYALHRYLITPLPAGRFIGWTPTDRTWKTYFITLLAVDAGPNPDTYLAEELGHSRPFPIGREQVSISFKLVRPVDDVSGVVVGEGV